MIKAWKIIIMLTKKDNAEERGGTTDREDNRNSY